MTLNKVVIFISVLFLLIQGSAIAASTDACYDTTDTVLMLHTDGTDASTTFTDSDAAKTVTANGNAQIDTAQSKFGGASGLFDGTGDYLSVADSTDWDFGTGDFTVDFWVRFNTTGNQTLIDIGGYAGGVMLETAGGNLDAYIAGTAVGTLGTWTWTPSTGTWYHVAIARNGTNLRAFINGSQIGSTVTNSSNITGTTAGVYVGFRTDGFFYVDGWIEELRIVKGTAVWTANFTPASAAYTDCSAAGGRKRMLI